MITTAIKDATIKATIFSKSNNNNNNNNNNNKTVLLGKSKPLKALTCSH